VVADAGYGDHPTFLQGLDDRQIAYILHSAPFSGVLKQF
jgi:SRSO17 transposase